MAVGSYRQMIEGVRFPEGPIAMANGRVLMLEIARGTLSRVTERSDIEVVAETRPRAQLPESLSRKTHATTVL